MAITMPELAEQIGLAELADIETQEATQDFLPAVVVGFADNDIALLHERYTDARQAELYGEFMYNDGEVTKKVREAAIANGMERTPIYDLQSLAAELFDRPEYPTGGHNPTSAIRIFPEAVTVDGNPILLPKAPRLVIDYAACLVSRSVVMDQLKFAEAGRTPFAYSPLTRLHFTNRVLMQTYDKAVHPGTTNLMIDKGLYIGREDGIASATNEMIEAQEGAGAPVDVADIILCSNLDHTTRADLETGMTNAQTLLKENGMLILRGVANPAEGEIGVDEILAQAMEAGFQEQAMLEYSAVSHSVGRSLLKKTADTERAIKAVVLAK